MVQFGDTGVRSGAVTAVSAVTGTAALRGSSHFCATWFGWSLFASSTCCRAVVTKAAASNTAAAAQNIPAKTIFMVSKLMNRAEAVNQSYLGVSFLKTARSKRINVVARIVPLVGESRCQR